MANTKLSALTELAVEPADADEIYVNDGGTSKRITYGTLKTALLARANHTGTQLASTISDFASAVAATSEVTANTAKLSADDPALISALAEVTAEGTDYAVILDTSVSPNALKKILISDLLDNASHSGDVTGSAALTAQPAIITGKGAVTVAGSDLLLVADVSASPQVLGQVTASSVAALATPEGTAILSTGEVGGTKFLREDGDGTCSWQTVPAGTGDLKADGTVPLTADWDVGSFDITAAQFHSDIATGTAPFTVASTTVVTNLNADQVDGNEASALLDRANHTGTQAAATISDFDTEVANNSAVSANTAKVTNATHTGDATGDTALTLQPAAITGKGAVTVDGADLLLVTDVSASPQVLGQVTAQSIANLAPAVQGSAILSSDTSPLVTDGYVLTADGAGGAAWEAAAGGGVDWTAAQDHDLTAATGDEVAFSFTSEVNKATSGNYTGIKLNVTETSAPGTDDRLLDLQVGGTSKAYISNSGGVYATNGIIYQVGQPTYYVAANTASGGTLSISLGQLAFAVHNGATAPLVTVPDDGAYTWSSQSTANETQDLFLFRDAAATLAQRNSTNAQVFRVYGTYTDSSNLERISLSVAGGVAMETAGTGADDIDLPLTPAGAGVVKFGTHSAIAAETVTGYITIKTADGTTRKLAVVS